MTARSQARLNLSTCCFFSLQRSAKIREAAAVAAIRPQRA
jgi:hypothetical protein